jgi:hypothetical protein
MFGKMADGFIGLALFISQWLGPGGEQDAVRIDEAVALAQGIRVKCAITIAWNDQMSDIVEAGIPLRLRIATITDNHDTTTFIRTLTCTMTDYTFTFADSAIAATPVDPVVSRKYSQMLIAVRDFSHWQVMLPAASRHSRFEAELLPSRAARLNRTVDVSGICGCKKFSKELRLR